MFFFRKKKKKSAAKAKKIVRRKKAKKNIRKKAKKAKAQKKRTVVKKTSKASKGEEVLIGKITHYFPHVRAGSFLIKKGPIALGDILHIKGHTTNFKQKISSLQINRVAIKKASKGDEVGIFAKSRVRINDKVYKVKI